jgi:glycosyltransferase involved in cell wall biosynthesis
LNIVGRGPYKDELKSLVNKKKIGDRIEFSENLSREDLLTKYHNADIFALLSQYESYGIVVAEALASGTPVIVANTSALSEWVDGENCLGINYPIDIKELVYLMEKNIGKQVHYNNLISWDMTAEMMKKLYEKEVWN